MAMIGYLAELRARLAAGGSGAGGADGFHARLAAGFAYLAGLTAADFAGLAEGETRRVAIDGERVFAMNQSYTTSPERPPKFEAHRRYLDLQFILAGEEKMLAAARRDCESLIAHDAEKDVEFFQPPSGPCSSLSVGPGMVAVFYPEDVHAPCLLSERPEPIQKCVVKVEL